MPRAFLGMKKSRQNSIRSSRFTTRDVDTTSDTSTSYSVMGQTASSVSTPPRASPAVGETSASSTESYSGGGAGSAGASAGAGGKPSRLGHGQTTASITSWTDARTLTGADRLTSAQPSRLPHTRKRFRWLWNPRFILNHLGMMLALILPLLLVTTTPIRQHWFRILKCQRELDYFTDTLEMPVPGTEGDLYLSEEDSGTYENTGTPSVEGDESHCKAVFDAAMLGHNQLLEMRGTAQDAISRSFITQCRPEYFIEEGEGVTSFLTCVAYHVWKILNPYCWPLLAYNPMEIVWDMLCNVGHCLLIFLIMAVAATVFPTAVPLNLFVLQLDILICIYCYQVTETDDSLKEAVNQIISADARLSTWEWPSSLPLAVYRGLLHQTLSNLDDMWDNSFLIMELPWMPLVGRTEITPEVLMQVCLTSAAACSMNLLAIIRPELSIYQLLKNSASFVIHGLKSGSSNTLEPGGDQNSKSMQRSLFTRLDGSLGIEKAVEMLLVRVSMDATLKRFFADVPLSLLRRKLVLILSTSFGGPVNYDTVALRDTHMRMIVKMGLSMSHFDLFVGHLVGVLADQGASPRDLAGVTMQIADLRPSFGPATSMDILIYEWPTVGTRIVESVVQEAVLLQRELAKKASTDRPTLIEKLKQSPLDRMRAGSAVVRPPGSDKGKAEPFWPCMEQLLDSDSSSSKQVSLSLYHLFCSDYKNVGKPFEKEQLLKVAKVLKSVGMDAATFDIFLDISKDVFFTEFRDQGQAIHAAAVKTVLPLRTLLDFAHPLGE